MVKAAPGAFITCDAPTKEYLVYLNRTKKPAFIILELDDNHLLVKDDMVEYVQRSVKDFNNKNVFTPPEVTQ